MTFHGLPAPATVPARLRPPDGRLRPVLVFFGITYAVTWSLVTAATLLSGNEARLPMLVAGSFAPSLVAAAVTARSDGREGGRSLLGRLLLWRGELRWCVSALGYLLAIKLCAALVYRLSTGSWPRFGDQSWFGLLVAIVAAGILGGPLSADIGWRGDALARLSTRFGAATATVVRGAAWACWHLPLVFLSLLSPFADQYSQSLLTYLLEITALSVAFAWLMGNTGGCLLLALLMHSAINEVKDIVPPAVVNAADMWPLSGSLVAWLTVALLGLCAVCLLTRMRHGGVERGRTPRRYRPIPYVRAAAQDPGRALVPARADRALQLSGR